MKNVICRVIAITVMLLLIIFVGYFNLGTAKASFSKYFAAISEYNDINSRMDTITDDVSKVRSELDGLRGKNAVDLEDADAIYKAVTSIDGVTEKSAILLRIRDGNISKLEEYAENQPDVTGRADGIQITVKVKDVKMYMQELDRLKLPRLGLNVVHPDNIIITYNTKGGQV